ncbi:hypothetical protein FB451DRAFT_1227622 [Mycena latifolia]|nr:hypothetical protein FB451DRAFT_1227622 [Mycena latifolia]
MLRINCTGVKRWELTTQLTSPLPKALPAFNIMKFSLLISITALACTTSAVYVPQSVISAPTDEASASHKDCKAGRLYCGWVLKKLDSSQYPLIVGQSGFDSGISTPSTLDDSLFMCSTDSSYPGYIHYAQYCGTNRCIEGSHKGDDHCDHH